MPSLRRTLFPPFVLIPILIAAIASSCFVVPANAQVTLTLNTFKVAPLSTADWKGIGDRVVKEAFRRIGISVKYKHLPSERALINANEGLEDGTYVRIEGIEKLYPNLVRVPEAIIEAEFVAFSKKSSLPVLRWDDLAPYHVGIVRGCKIAEMNTADAKAVTKAKDLKTAFYLLSADKVDVVVYDRLHGNVLLNSMHLKGIHAGEQPLARQNMYLYLTRKHAALAPRAAEAIRSMKADGTFQTIVGDVMNSLSL